MISKSTASPAHAPSGSSVPVPIASAKYGVIVADTVCWTALLLLRACSGKLTALAGAWKVPEAKPVSKPSSLSSVTSTKTFAAGVVELTLIPSNIVPEQTVSLSTSPPASVSVRPS